VSDVSLDLTHRLSPAHLGMLRRGSGISDEVIAARGCRTWRTRYVNTFTPRLFSATRLMIQTLVRCAAESPCLQGDRGDRNDRGDVKREIPRVLFITTSQVTGTARRVAQEQEADMDADAVTARRVGRVLRKMRWPPERTKTARGWAVNLAELHRLSQAYGVAWPSELCTTQQAPPPTNVTSVISVTSVTAPELEAALREEDGELPPAENDREVIWI